MNGLYSAGVWKSSFPQPRHDAPPFRADGMGIDGSRGHLRMAEQFLDDVELDALLDTGDGVAVPQPLRGRLGTRQGGFLHHRGDVVIAGLPGPAPQPTLRMPLADAVHKIQDVQEGVGDGDGPVYVLAALLQAAKGQGLVPEVDAVGRELQL
jgi:hypothetical protein